MKTVRGIIDRIEGETAVVELNGRITKSIYLSVLPYGIKEGDVILFQNGRWWFDQEETVRRKTEISKQSEDLFE